jgi:trigger factor
MTAGEERRFPVTYPADFEQATLAGQTRHFQVNLNQVEEKILPALDDEFASQVGNFENMKQLQNQIQKNIAAEVGQRNQQRLDTALVQSLLALNEFEVPPSMVANYVEQLIADQERRGGQSMPDEERNQAVEQLKPGAEFALKRWFLMEAVGKQESITVSDEDFELHLTRIAEAEGNDVDTVKRKVKQARAEERMREDLQHRKVFEFLVSQAKIKEEEVPLTPPDDSGSKQD